MAEQPTERINAIKENSYFLINYLQTVRDGLDTAFNGCVLMMSTHTTESLWPILNMSLEFFRIKREIISMQLFELDSTLESFFLELPH